MHFKTTDTQAPPKSSKTPTRATQQSASLLSGPSGPSPEAWSESDRTANDPVALKRAFLDHLHFSLGQTAATATPRDRFLAVCLMVRDRLAQRWHKTQIAYEAAN